MSKSMNRITLAGYVGKDPDVRNSGNGMYARFNLATSTGGGKDKYGNDIPEKTQWHNIVAFDKVCETISAQVRKGSYVIMEGRVEYNSYEKDGTIRQATDIILTNLLHPRKEKQPF